MKMNNLPMSDGLQILSQFFATKTQYTDSFNVPEVPPAAPSLLQTPPQIPVVETPIVQVYEPIGRGRGPKILLVTIVAAGLGFLLIRKYRQWREDRKQYR
jgi:hypothetical protein